MRSTLSAIGTVLFLAVAPQIAAAQSSDDLAAKLSNPISDLISVPFQFNYDDGFGDGNGQQSILNIQPVIPISLGEDWNMISRTILPIVNRGDFAPGLGSQTGFGNITQSLFFSPKQPSASGVIWGVGPVFSIPTATNNIANNQWGAGITGVALKQSHGWTVGILANQIWSVSGNDKFGSYSTAFVQPFVTYTTKKATTFALNTESTYNWDTEEWSVPINLTVGQIIKINKRPVQLTGGLRYWAESPDGGPQDLGARLIVTYLFPKG
jgi:hypothetical protein